MAGFRDGHEVAHHVRVGDGNRSAGSDLFLEQGDDAAPAAEDVAETDSGELGVADRVHLLDNQLSGAFGGTHDAGGIDGFICRNHDEDFAAAAVCCFGDIFCTKDVIFYGFHRMGFHEGDVFVSSGVEDDLGPVVTEDGVDPFFVADVGDDGDCIDVRIFIAQFLMDLVDAVFTFSEEEELLRMHFGDLAAEFRADGAAGTGDEDDFAPDVACDAGKIELDGIAAEKVFQFNFAKLLDGDLAVDEFVDTGKDLDVTTGMFAGMNDFPDDRAAHGGHSDNDFGDLILSGDLLDFPGSAQYFGSVHQLVLFERRVIDEANEGFRIMVALEDFAGDDRSGVTGTDDQYPVGLGGLLHQDIAQDADTHAAGTNE